MKITLIQTAFNREKELARFIESLHAQLEMYNGIIQYIFVDQGDNSHLFSIIQEHLEFIYIKTHRCSLSHARNIGLKYANGDIICFPDDDCWYPEGLLNTIQFKFSKSTYDGYTGIVTNLEGVPYNKYSSENKLLSKERHFGASSICMFLKYDKNIQFDENIGVGTNMGIGSGEETDYLSRYISNGHKVMFCPDLAVFHPINLLCRNEEYLTKTYNYSIGTGYVANKNNYSLKHKVDLILRPIAGMIIFFIKGDIYMAKRSYAILRGRIRGLNLPIL